jgi:hypothetical protein
MQDGAKGKGGVWETPKAGDARLGPTRVSNIVIGNNQLAARAALQALQSQGYQGRIHTLSLAGPVQQVPLSPAPPPHTRPRHKPETLALDPQASRARHMWLLKPLAMHHLLACITCLLPLLGHASPACFPSSSTPSPLSLVPQELLL